MMQKPDAKTEELDPFSGTLLGAVSDLKNDRTMPAELSRG